MPKTMKRNTTRQEFHCDLVDLAKGFPSQRLLKDITHDLDVIWGDFMWWTDRASNYIESYNDKVI